jgi:hypothetical protein
MSLVGVPWAVGGGAQHSVALGRMLAYSATNGATGISGVSDLKVTALTTPGTSVNVAPGGAVLLNRYPGNNAAGQSYIIRNDSQEQVEINATGSGGGATTYLIAYVNDPEFSLGDPPDTVLDGPYTFFKQVNSITGLNYPFVPLAKIVQPANTATITSGMITDIRDVANPRKDEVMRPRPILVSDTTQLTLGARMPTGEYFPGDGSSLAVQQIDIPTWATRMKVEAHWSGVRYAVGNYFGSAWVEWGPFISGSTNTYTTQAYSWDAVDNAAIYRNNWETYDDVAIPAAMRGTTQPFVLKAGYATGSAQTGKISMDSGSGTALIVRFEEVADRSTT